MRGRMLFFYLQSSCVFLLLLGVERWVAPFPIVWLSLFLFPTFFHKKSIVWHLYTFCADIFLFLPLGATLVLLSISDAVVWSFPKGERYIQGLLVIILYLLYSLHTKTFSFVGLGFGIGFLIISFLLTNPTHRIHEV